MGHFGACACRNKRCNACITKQIENLHGAARLGCFADQTIHIGPVCCLLREHTHMAERGEAAVKRDAVMLHWPGFAKGHMWERPTSHAFFIGITGKDRVGFVPFAFRQARKPDCLTFRAHDAIGTVLLKLQPVAAVQQRVVV